jgi:hypothetical protein
MSNKKTIYVCEAAPVDSLITDNTARITEHRGRYTNENAIGRYCGCPCHNAQQIMHMMPCCDYSGRLKERRVVSAYNCHQLWSADP